MSVSRNLPLIVTLGFHPNILLPEPVMAGTNTIQLKTGTREMPHTLTSSDSRISADALAQLPSEKRAQPEQTMQSRADHQSRVYDLKSRAEPHPQRSGQYGYCTIHRPAHLPFDPEFHH